MPLSVLLPNEYREFLCGSESLLCSFLLQSAAATAATLALPAGVTPYHQFLTSQGGKPRFYLARS